MNPIDVACYRPLKAGKEYEKLIPPYKGIDYSFDKTGDNSNTYDTLRFMAQWSEKYTGQMSKVAQVLKGRTLQETVNNIYNFLYNHFQYKIDGQEQILYSPSAAWHFREKGFDCKTYSLLASTILQNLQIPHAFRMVQQAGTQPNFWSHVYVIVPNGNSHYVIDATTHSNKEVTYTKKHDYNMKHRGLASPFAKFSGLGCACQGTPIAHTGLGSPNVFSKTIANFHRFLDDAEAIGIPRNVTDKMVELVRFNIERGIDPNMGEVLRKALEVQPQGAVLGSPLTPYSPISQFSFYGSTNYAPQAGLGSILIDSGILPDTGSGSGGLKVGGINVGDTVGKVASGNYVGAAIGVLKSVLPIDKTFGAVFANGFDLSCWGSSFSEQKAKVVLEKDMPFIIEWSGVYKSPTTENLNRFMYLTQVHINDALNGQQSKYAKCTQKGHALRQKTVEELRKNVLQDFTSQGFQLIPAGKKIGQYAIKGYEWANKDLEWDAYTVVAPNEQPAQASPVASTTSQTDATGTKTTTATNADGSKTITKTAANGQVTTENVAAPAKSGIGTIAAVGSVLLIGAKLLL